MTGLPSDAMRVSLDISMSSFYMLFSQALRADQICREFCREFIVFESIFITNSDRKIDSAEGRLNCFIVLSRWLEAK